MNQDQMIKYGPKCPNHHVDLVDLPVPMVQKGMAICPISGASFDFEVELDQVEMKQDSQGNIIKSPRWKTDGQEK